MATNLETEAALLMGVRGIEDVAKAEGLREEGDAELLVERPHGEPSPGKDAGLNAEPRTKL